MRGSGFVSCGLMMLLLSGAERRTEHASNTTTSAQAQEKTILACKEMAADGPDSFRSGCGCLLFDAATHYATQHALSVHTHPLSFSFLPLSLFSLALELEYCLVFVLKKEKGRKREVWRFFLHPTHVGDRAIISP